MTLEPLNGHVLLVQCKDPRSLTNGGNIILPEGNMGNLLMGEIIAIDETIPADKHPFKVGHIAYFKKNEASSSVLLDGGQLAILIRECMLLGVVKDVAPVRMVDVYDADKAKKLEQQRASERAKSNGIATPDKQILIAQ